MSDQLHLDLHLQLLLQCMYVYSTLPEGLDELVNILDVRVLPIYQLQRNPFE